jgi:hypothetical protein
MSGPSVVDEMQLIAIIKTQLIRGMSNLVYCGIKSLVVSPTAAPRLPRPSITVDAIDLG